MTELEIARHNALIDPVLHFWSWEVPVYLFLGGLAAGVMIATAALALRRDPDAPVSRALRLAPLAVPVALSIGMLALFLDLEHKLYVWRFYLAFQPTSPMSWGSWVLLAVYPASLLLALATAPPDLVEKVAAKVPQITDLRAWATENVAPIAKTNLILGVGLGIYTGILLSAFGARGAWNSPLLGVLFLCSGLSTGLAFTLLLPVSEEEHHLLSRLDVVAITVEGLILILLLVGFQVGDAQAHAAGDLLLGGALMAPFLSLVVLAGLLTPLFLEVSALRGKLPRTLAAPALVLIGGFALRWILVVAGQA